MIFLLFFHRTAWIGNTWAEKFGFRIEWRKAEIRTFAASSERCTIHQSKCWNVDEKCFLLFFPFSPSFFTFFFWNSFTCYSFFCPYFNFPCIFSLVKQQATESKTKIDLLTEELTAAKKSASLNERNANELRENLSRTQKELEQANDEKNLALKKVEYLFQYFFRFLSYCCCC